ncbi:MAG: WecB/TagA/CpsF family glycosyltransferase [Anaerolineae bacterium]|nr:WecB/TagA/CpsF family glycosyltransferase [Thermoflexales bacterium]MDW8406212.1 WecB/TagA/CpsF family glycosyltransferase [Anaerolineae bacterium]
MIQTLMPPSFREPAHTVWQHHTDKSEVASSIDILGVPISAVSMTEACEQVVALVQHGGVHQIATVNPEFIMAAQRDRAFADLLRNTTLNVPDGVGVLWAARRMGRSLPERVAGVDLMERLCALGSQHRWRAFFLGAREGVAERAAALLAFKYNGLLISGAYAGSPRAEDEADIVSRVRKARPNLLFVAYGAPAQDKWLARNLPLIYPTERPYGELPGLVGMGVGGAFDFLAGAQQRAPRWIQDAGLEWLYRLLREPRRWRRQLALAHFVWHVMMESTRLTWRRR